MSRADRVLGRHLPSRTWIKTKARTNQNSSAERGFWVWNRTVFTVLAA